MTAPNTPTPELEPDSLITVTRNAAEGGVDISSQVVLHILDQCTAAIAKLTAERDAAEGRRDFWAADAVHSHKQAEAAEKRAKELEHHLDIAVHGNKLLSERIAVLETALEPFADLAGLIGDAPPDVTMFYIMTKVDGEIIQMSLEYLRRALAAREAK